MSVPTSGDVPGGLPGSVPARNRLVGLGLVMVVLGWLALVADIALAAAGLQAGSLVAVLSLKNDAATLAEMLIVTGLGLAILGGLREGFGALNRFFDAVLQRSAAPRPAARPAPVPEPPPIDLDEEIAPPRRAAADRMPERMPDRVPDRVPDRASERMPERMSERMPERGSPPGPATALARNYQILPDGSVEVETLLGTRVFASMEEARDFIR